MSEHNDELKYWRGVWKAARTLHVDISGDGWCNYWHQHFDWDSRGKCSRFEHRKHIRPLMRAFSRVQCELAHQDKPHQVYVCIYPTDPGSDALYVHTPNPHSAFPAQFEDLKFISALPPLLMGLVSLDRYQIGVSECDGDKWYTIIPRQL
jgi:hypothetical protein